jgi:DNA-binding transcriptional regulator YhcF (GntR family)
MTNSPAYRDLNSVERSILSDKMKRYDGSNNGRIPYSVREAATELRISKDTARRAISRLQDQGFIVQITRGAFSLKQRHATEWRLTELNCDVTNSLPSKELMRWPTVPPEVPSNHFTVPVARRTVPVAVPIGTCNRTEGSKKASHGTCSRTVEAENSISRYDHRYTSKLPGRREPIGERGTDPQPATARPHIETEAGERSAPEGSAVASSPADKNQGDTFVSLGDSVLAQLMAKRAQVPTAVDDSNEGDAS